MFKISLSSIAGACAIAMCLLSSGTSHAGAIGATGFAFPFTDLSCFAMVDGGAVVNNCAALKSWIVSDNISAGNHTVLVTGFRPSGGNLVCAACATTKEGGNAACTAETSPVFAGRHVQFSLGTLPVPTFGSLFVECRMTLGGRFDSVSF